MLTIEYRERAVAILEKEKARGRAGAVHGTPGTPGTPGTSGMARGVARSAAPDVAIEPDPGLLDATIKLATNLWAQGGDPVRATLVAERAKELGQRMQWGNQFEPGLAGDGAGGGEAHGGSAANAAANGGANEGANGAVNGMMEGLKAQLDLLTLTLSHPIHNYSSPGALIDALRADDTAAWR